MLPVLAIALLHLLLALAVASDTAKLESRRGTELVGPLTWSFATFVIGIPAALTYWMMHRSVLHPKAGESKGTTD